MIHGLTQEKRIGCFKLMRTVEPLGGKPGGLVPRPGMGQNSI